MFDFIRDSGASGWITILFTLAGLAAVTTVGRRWGRPGSVAAAWAVAVLASGAIGHGAGQRAVDRALGSPSIDESKRAALLSRGTAEAAATGIVAGSSALLICAVGGLLVVFRKREPGTAT
jgi:hypothetical protein